MKRALVKGFFYIAAVLCLAPSPLYAMPWSWDMFAQPSHKAQEEKAIEMPEGTVPVKGKGVALKDRAEAQKAKNPFSATPESIEAGRLKYLRFCSPCHGDGGKGDGLVGQKYVTPTDLTGEYVQAKPDGDIFYTITNGGMAIMPSYGDSVEEHDRWHIANYIKHAFSAKGK
ncbi:MAG: c-type cytochrome [Deltaproteobacteria bacterium]